MLVCPVQVTGVDEESLKYFHVESPLYHVLLQKSFFAKRNYVCSPVDVQGLKYCNIYKIESPCFVAKILFCKMRLCVQSGWRAGVEIFSQISPPLLSAPSTTSTTKHNVYTISALGTLRCRHRSDPTIQCYHCLLWFTGTTPRASPSVCNKVLFRSRDTTCTP